MISGARGQGGRSKVSSAPITPELRRLAEDVVGDMLEKKARQARHQGREHQCPRRQPRLDDRFGWRASRQTRPDE